MWYLYLIQNDTTFEKYIGITTDLRRRVSEHNLSMNRSTKRKTGQWVLIYAEAYRSKEDAVIRERKMKLYGKSKQELLKRCGNSLLKQA
jgi:putative endonuclease